MKRHSWTPSCLISKENVSVLSPNSSRYAVNTSEYEIEEHLYKRNLDKVHHALLAYSNTTSSNDYQQLLAITKETQPRNVIAADSWTVGSLHDPNWKSFREDVFEFSHSLPPGFKGFNSESLKPLEVIVAKCSLYPGRMSLWQMLLS